MKKLALLLFGLAILASAQILTTAEPLGKGKRTAFVSSAALQVKDYTTLTSSNAQFIYGLHDRLDMYVGGGLTTAVGRVQKYAFLGANMGLWKNEKWFSVSTYHVFLIPVDRHSEACGLLWLPSIVVSKNLVVKKFKLTPYSGYLLTLPLGHTDGKRFTPPSPTHNLAAGVMIPRGQWSFFAEYCFGKTQEIPAFGIAYTF
ncbi:MAG: hypothetical protein NTX98_02915 [Candidatus Doudnabacteria bacterium]|nr:hypothetical protein [Candidatus Doudnabacteria bacterium]